MIEENNIIYCRKCNAKVPDGKKCNECGCYVDSVDLSITSEHRCPKCSAMMKESICRNCGYNYFTALEEEQERRSAFIRSFVPDTTKRKIAVIVVCILTFVLGVVIGTTKANYSNSVEVDRLRKSLTHEKDNTTRVQAQFDQYKATMQPYEAQQEANAKAAAEQKAAEEKAKKEAEEKAAAEKAAQEAESKKQQEEAAKAQSLGMSASEFQQTFNNITATNGFDAFLGKSTETGEMTRYNTLNPDVSLICNSQKGFLQSISITAKRTTSESLTDASYYAVTTSLALDSSLTVNAVDSLMAELINGASNNFGTDYTKIKNGIAYTANVSSSSIFFYYTKAK